jgi:hypothetical protein
LVPGKKAGAVDERSTAPAFLFNTYALNQRNTRHCFLPKAQAPVLNDHDVGGLCRKLSISGQCISRQFRKRLVCDPFGNLALPKWLE